MSNNVKGKTYKLDSTGSIKTTGVTIQWIMHYADGDGDIVDLLDSSGGNPVFYYKNIDVSALGNYQYFYLGGQRVTGLFLNILTASNLVWIGVA